MKAIIIEDELLALSYLEHHLMKMANFSLEIIGKFTNPYDAIDIKNIQGWILLLLILNYQR